MLEQVLDRWPDLNPSTPPTSPAATDATTTTDPSTTATTTSSTPAPGGTGRHPTERETWLAWRRAGIGGSDVAGILGLSPWASAYSVWVSKVTELVDEDNERFEFGRRAEPMLAEWFHDRTGLFVAGEQSWCSHLEHALTQRALHRSTGSSSSTTAALGSSTTPWRCSS